MLIFALAAGVSFLVIGTVVGVRMLRLANRNHTLPELLLGAGFTSLTFVTLPAIFLSLGARLGSPAVQAGAFAFGLVPVIGFAMCLYGFTARVFRPGGVWARSAVVLSGVVCAVGVAGTVATRWAQWGADRVVGPGWSVLMIVTFAVGMTWTGAESLRYHRMLVRRLALGLADPVVCDRFRLWAVGNLGAVVGTLVVAGSLLHGWRVVAHPVPILGITVAIVSLSISWYLAFLPPPAYLRRVEARAARG